MQSLVARLPDKGENIRKKLDDLTNQLENLKYISSTENSDNVAPSASQEFVPKDVKPRKDLKSVKQELQALKDLQMAKETCINPDANEVASIFAGLNL
jgi:dTDP-D-glucose 4,6-dehydratase